MGVNLSLGLIFEHKYIHKICFKYSILLFHNYAFCEGGVHSQEFRVIQLPKVYIFQLNETVFCDIFFFQGNLAQIEAFK